MAEVRVSLHRVYRLRAESGRHELIYDQAPWSRATYCILSPFESSTFIHRHPHTYETRDSCQCRKYAGEHAFCSSSAPVLFFAQGMVRDFAHVAWNRGTGSPGTTKSAKLHSNSRVSMRGQAVCPCVVINTYESL